MGEFTKVIFDRDADSDIRLELSRKAEESEFDFKEKLTDYILEYYKVPHCNPEKDYWISYHLPIIFEIKYHEIIDSYDIMITGKKVS